MTYRMSLGFGIVLFALFMANVSPIRADAGLAATADEQVAYNRSTCVVQSVPHCLDAAAQYHIGLVFKGGIGVEKDPVAALGWFRCAARSDGRIGIDAARWAKKLSSALDRPTVSTATGNGLGCRTLADIAPPPDTSEVFERPDAGISRYWENLKIKLNQFIEAFLRSETAEPSGGTAADWTAAYESPKYRTQSNVSVPERQNLWSRVFFLPADGTVVGTQHIAWDLGAEEMYRDIRNIAENSNDITLGLFAVFWWVLIGKTLMSVGRAIFRPYRGSGVPRLGQNR